jgi:hypothetical protein
VGESAATEKSFAEPPRDGEKDKKKRNLKKSYVREYKK